MRSSFPDDIAFHTFRMIKTLYYFHNLYQSIKPRRWNSTKLNYGDMGNMKLIFSGYTLRPINPIMPFPSATCVFSVFFFFYLFFLYQTSLQINVLKRTFFLKRSVSEELSYIKPHALCVPMWEGREGWLKEDRRRNRSHDVLFRFRTRDLSYPTHGSRRCKPLRIGNGIAAISRILWGFTAWHHRLLSHVRVYRRWLEW